MATRPKKWFNQRHLANASDRTVTMGKPTEPYVVLWVETYEPASTAGRHGAVHVRPTVDSGYPTSLQVRCSKSFSRDYPIGTRFQIRAKLTDKEGGTDFLHSPHTWPPLAIQRP